MGLGGGTINSWDGYVRLAELSASHCSEIVEGLVLEHKEEGSSELHKYSILCEEGFRGSVHVTY
jgi:hypothetical protein